MSLIVPPNEEDINAPAAATFVASVTSAEASIAFNLEWSASVNTLESDAASTAALISAFDWSAVAPDSIPDNLTALSLIVAPTEEDNNCSACNSFLLVCAEADSAESPAAYSVLNAAAVDDDNELLALLAIVLIASLCVWALAESAPLSVSVDIPSASNPSIVDCNDADICSLLVCADADKELTDASVA